jgi:hypothetical protein
LAAYKYKHPFSLKDTLDFFLLRILFRNITLLLVDSSVFILARGLEQIREKGR